MEPLTPTDRRRAELTAREAAILVEISEIVAAQREDEDELKTTPGGGAPLDVAGLRIRAIEARLKSLRSRHTLAARELSETRAALAALPSPLSAEPADEAAVKARAGRVLSAAINGELPITEAERVRAAQQAWVASADAWQTEEEQYGKAPLGRDLRPGPLK